MAKQAVADALDLHARDYQRAALRELMDVVAVARPSLDLRAAARERARRLPVELRSYLEVHLFALHRDDFLSRREPERRLVGAAVGRIFHDFYELAEREGLRRLRPEI